MTCSGLPRSGKKGVLALMCDSTNAERKGFTASERTVGRTFDNIFAEHTNTRIIIATFASNVDRVAADHQFRLQVRRKVVVEGPQHGERHQHGVRAGLSEYTGQHPDRPGENEKLSGRADGADHHRKPGRVHGGSFQNGRQHAQESDDQTGGYRNLQFQSHSRK